MRSSPVALALPSLGNSKVSDTNCGSLSMAEDPKAGVRKSFKLSSRPSGTPLTGDTPRFHIYLIDTGWNRPVSKAASFAVSVVSCIPSQRSALHPDPGAVDQGPPACSLAHRS